MKMTDKITTRVKAMDMCDHLKWLKYSLSDYSGEWINTKDHSLEIDLEDVTQIKEDESSYIIKRWYRTKTSRGITLSIGLLCIYISKNRQNVKIISG